MYLNKVVKEVHQLFVDHSYIERGCNITDRCVWLLLANAVFLTVIAAQAPESYFRVITLILILSAQMEGVSSPYATHKLIFVAKRSAVSNGRVVVNGIIVSF